MSSFLDAPGGMNAGRLSAMDAEIAIAKGVPDTPLAARLRAEDSAARQALLEVITDAITDAEIDGGLP